MKKTILLVLFLTFTIGLIRCDAKAKMVACVGNSDTFGYGLSRQDAYPAQLEKILQCYDQQWEVENFGVSGATVLRLGDLPYVSTAVYQQALASEPDIVIFEFGGNAARPPNRGYIQEHYANDYINLIDAFSELDSKPQIWLCQPLDKIRPDWATHARIIRDEIIPIITQVSIAKNIPVIDFYNVFKDAHHLYQGDGIHPTVEGSKIMAEMAASVILGVRWPPDFNGDSKVDIEDLVMLIENWNQDEPSLDIAPPPFGDGVIDVFDLEILMSLWEKETNDHTLTAYWRLDEFDGMIATDSADEHDGILYGEPLWQPEGGMINGALAFDGIDDYVSTDPVLNPTNDVFSVVAWIKDGSPGQVIISQKGGANWLMADIVDGALRTNLRTPATGGRDPKPPGPPLICTSGVTDGNWHRVGFIRNCSDRILYVDGIEVASDTAETLEFAGDGLYLGAGSSLEPYAFWSGLIDDVRIYNRVVRP